MKIFAHVIFGTVLLSFVLNTGCSSSPKTNASETPTAPGAPAPVSLTQSDMIDRYSLTELNAAANLLRVVYDESLGAAGKKSSEDLVGCAIDPVKSQAMLNPLKALIDGRTHGERDTYVSDGAAYMKANSFETCSASCACGAYADVLENVDANSVRKIAPKIHERSLSRLKLKAEKQTAESSRICARKQNWFCQSDLKKYLEKESGS